MAACHSELFIGLAVIVNDWDALPSPESTDLIVLEEPRVVRRQSQASTTSRSCADIHTPSMSNGLVSMAEGMWARVSFTLKEKLRHACVEMLRRTEDSQVKSGHDRQEDEAHMLD